MSCVWIWDNIGWGESPQNPHNCPSGSHCNEPPFEGTFYGQIADTICEPD